MTVKKFFVEILQGKKAFTPQAAQQGIRISDKGGVGKIEFIHPSPLQIAFRAHVSDEDELFESTILFHRQTGMITGTHCDCSSHYCKHAYALLVFFEELNPDKKKRSGVYDVSTFFLNTTLIDEIENCSKRWVETEENKIKLLEPAQWEQNFSDVLLARHQPKNQGHLTIHYLFTWNQETHHFELALQPIRLSDQSTVQLGPLADIRKIFLGKWSSNFQDTEISIEDFSSADRHLFHRIYSYLENEKYVSVLGFHELLLEAKEKKWEHLYYNSFTKPICFRPEPILLSTQIDKENERFTLTYNLSIPEICSDIRRSQEGLFLDQEVPLIYLGPSGEYWTSNPELTGQEYLWVQQMEVNGIPASLFSTFCNELHLVKRPSEEEKLLLDGWEDLQEIQTIESGQGVIAQKIGKVLPDDKKKIPFEISVSQKLLEEYTRPPEPLSYEIALDLLEGDRVALAITFHYGAYSAEIQKGFDHPFFGTSMLLPRDLETERKSLDLLLKPLRYDTEFARWIIYLEDLPNYYNSLSDLHADDRLEVRLSNSLQKRISKVSKPPELTITPTVHGNFFEVTFQIPDFLNDIPIASLRQLLSGKDCMIRTKKGKLFYIDHGKESKKLSESFLDLIEGLDVENFVPNGKKVISKWNLWTIYQHRQWFSPEALLKNEEILQNLINQPQELTEVEPPIGFKGDLRSYQKEGISWIQRLQTIGFEGILADDMGLGKTIQTIAFLLLEKEQGRFTHGQKNLIICPTSLMQNWESEITRFAPGLKSKIIAGEPEYRQNLILNDNSDIWITSYPLLQKDIEFFLKRDFYYLILDEAQHIKNSNTRNAQLAKQIAATHRLVLTGTPIENSLKDLWSLFDFIMPGFLHSYRSFSQFYLTGEVGAQERLKKRIQPFILRRLKRDVLQELPPVTQTICRCELDKGQKSLYLEVVKSVISDVDEEIGRIGMQRARIHILAGLTRLKQLCCHPELLGVSEPSAKFELFLELIEELRDGGHRAIIFSQYTKMLEIISKEFDARGIHYSYLDGNTSDRLERVSGFNGDDTIPFFLVSLRAGGIGLNLTGADTVIHYDLWWNPAVENQATDRVHRIGQAQNVHVYKLIVNGTIEQKIMELQNEKQELIESIIDENNYNLLSQLSWKEIKERLLEYN